MSTAYGPDSADWTPAQEDGHAGRAGTATAGHYHAPDPDAGTPGLYGASSRYGSVPPPPPPPVWQGPVPPPPPPPAWHEYGDPSWPGGPASPGGPWGSGQGNTDGSARRKRRAMAIAAGVAAVALATGGTAWALSGPTTLTAAQIASQTDPALVDVMTTLGYQQGSAAGTGMVLTPNGEVLTNNHVVEGATSIKVRDIGNGRTYTAAVVGYNETSDVAVLQLHGASGLRTVKTGDSGSVKVGQQVTALGNAGGRNGTPSVATGTVTGLNATITASDQGSGTTEQLTGMIRTNAGIQPGDSGGPLVNGSGQVVGMNTAASSSSGQIGTTAAETSAAFSIPINRALSIANQIEAGTSSSTVHIGATAFLGVEVSASGFSAGNGVTIVGTVSGTAAANAGLGAGDTILSVAGHSVTSGSDVQSVIARYHPGDKVTVVWQDQSGQTHSSVLTLTLGPTA
jgi:S1-C subfamily serine protease